MKKIAVILALLAPLALAIPSANAVTTITTRIAVFKPNGTGWTPLNCDGTDVLDGVGNVRMMGFATASGGSPRVRFRRDYTNPAVGRGQDSPWYSDGFATLPNGEEINVTDIVQDLDPEFVDHRFIFQRPGFPEFTKVCNFQAINIPSVSEGHISHRTAALDRAESIRIEVRRYTDKVVIPCGSTLLAGRVEVRFFATNNLTADLDFHWHQEFQSPRAIGPNQDPDPTTRRFGEEGMDNVRLTAGTETLVAQLTTSAQFVDRNGVLNKSKRNTFHFAQQMAPGQPPLETFCTVLEP